MLWNCLACEAQVEQKDIHEEKMLRFKLFERSMKNVEVKVARCQYRKTTIDKGLFFQAEYHSV